MTKLPPELQPAFPDLPQSLTESEAEVFGRYVYVDPRLLHFADWNYKRDDPVKQAALSAQMKKNGQIENIHIRKKPDGTFEVFNGNHRLTYFLESNAERVLAFYHGEISAQEAHRRAIETNETFFQDDPSKLAEILKSLTDAHGLDDIVSTTGMTEEYVNDLLEQVEPTWDFAYQPPPEEPEEPEEPQTHLADLIITVPSDIAQIWEQMYLEKIKAHLDTSREEFLVQLINQYADDTPD